MIHSIFGLHKCIGVKSALVDRTSKLKAVECEERGWHRLLLLLSVIALALCFFADHGVP